jgi:uncharacterized tellurite resistance protein B-like protein
VLACSTGSRPSYGDAMSFVDRVLERLGVAADDFEPPDPAPDQALLDVLQLVMLVDGTSTEAERERIREHLEWASWPDGASPFAYAQASMAKVRAALADEAALSALLASVAERLRSDEDREFALGLVRELAGIDGTVDDRESALVERLRRRFDGS